MAARKKTTDSAEVSEVLTDEELKAAAEPEEASTKEGEPHKRTVVVLVKVPIEDAAGVIRPPALAVLLDAWPMVRRPSN